MVDSPPPPFSVQASDHESGHTVTAYANDADDDEPFLGYDEKAGLPSLRKGGSYRHVHTDSADEGGRGLRKDSSWRITRWIKSTATNHPILGALMAGLAIVGVSVGLGWIARLQPFNIDDNRFNEHRDDISGDGIWLTATLVAIDSVGQTMTIDWNIADADCGGTGENYTDFNIFMDQNLLVPSSNTPVTLSNNIPPPLFFLNCTTFSTKAAYVANSPIFRTQLTLTTYSTHRTQQSYPFDMYIANMWMWAETAPGNLSADVYMYDTQGLAPGFSATVVDSGTAPSDVKYKEIQVARGTVVKVYSIFIAVAIWLVTLVFIAIAVHAVILRRKMSSAVLVLPATTLFAFTQLRGTMPGAPVDFGAVLDFMCILPCMIIVTFCSVVMLALFLWRDPEKDHHEQKAA